MLAQGGTQASRRDAPGFTWITVRIKLLEAGPRFEEFEDRPSGDGTARIAVGLEIALQRYLAAPLMPAMGQQVWDLFDAEQFRDNAEGPVFCPVQELDHAG